MAVGGFDNFLHTIYTNPKVIEDLAIRDRPGLALIPKDESQGKITGYPFKLSPPMGLAATRADAQLVSGATATGSQSVVGEWLVQNGRYAGGVEIDDKELAESEASSGAAYARKFATETDALIDAFGDRMASYFFGDKGFSVATGTNSSGTITVTSSAEDIFNVYIGQALVASASNGQTSTDDLLGTSVVGYVTTVNRDAATFTVSLTPGGSTATPTGWTGTMFFFNAGDFQGDQAASTGTQVGVKILESAGDWITSSAASDTFNNVLRSSDTRLSGVRLSSTEATAAGSIEGRLKQLCVKIQQTSGNHGPLTIFLEPQQWQALADILESRSQTSIVEKKYEGKSGRDGTFGYSVLRLATNAGMCDIVCEPHVKHQLAWALNLKHWKIASVDGFPRVMNGDGLKMLRKATSDRYEFRITSYSHAVTPYPSYSGRTPLAAV